MYGINLDIVQCHSFSTCTKCFNDLLDKLQVQSHHSSTEWWFFTWQRAPSRKSKVSMFHWINITYPINYIDTINIEYSIQAPRRHRQLTAVWSAIKNRSMNPLMLTSGQSNDNTLWCNVTKMSLCIDVATVDPVRLNEVRLSCRSIVARQVPSPPA